MVDFKSNPLPDLRVCHAIDSQGSYDFLGVKH